ncbi:MAG: hypothetical protein PHN38_02740 [Sulfurospirillaceae bacterium]|nr:hypothetical protein [Sulfurospirillaceae bacterium]
MKQWTKALNIGFFIVVLGLFFSFRQMWSVSTDLMALLPQNKSKTLFETYSSFKNAKEVFVATQGFDKDSLSHIKKIEERLTKENLLKLESDIKLNAPLKKYIQENIFYLRELNEKPSQNVAGIVQKLFEQITTNPYYTAIDTQDPLGYFKPLNPNKELNIKNAHLALGDFGYLSVFSLSDTSNTKESFQKVYDIVKQEVGESPNIKAFSPIFYFVENAQKTQKDVTLIIFFSTALLLFLYLLVIKNIALLFNTILTLATSGLIAFMATCSVFGSVSIFTLAFGNAVGTLAIDYMFHHYFHDHYSKSKPFSRTVFFGFLTTFGAFFIISFVDFPLIKQLSFFAMISLFLSYMQFAILFPMIGFKQAKTISTFRFSVPLPYKTIATISFLTILGAIYFLHVETDLRRLDYQNKPLMELEGFFKKATLKQDYTPILIEANSVDELILRSKTIQKEFQKTLTPLAFFVDKQTFAKRQETLQALDFEMLEKEVEKEASRIGFRENFFKNAYSQELLYPQHTELDASKIQEMGFDVVTKNNLFYTHAMVKTEDVKEVEKRGFAYGINSKEMFLESLKHVTYQLLFGGALVLVLMTTILLITCRKTLALSSSYVLFPTALILLVGINDFTIIHIFMLFIVIAFGIDYGIYMGAKEHSRVQTKNAILFSLMSTFAGFGVLIFSQIGALFAMGLVSCLGVGAIFVLLLGGDKE